MERILTSSFGRFANDQQPVALQPASMEGKEMKFVASVTFRAPYYHQEKAFDTIQEAKDFITSARIGSCGEARPGADRVECASIHGMCDDSELLDPLDPKFVYLREYANL